MLKEPALGKRAVLGELGNKVLKNTEISKGKDAGALKNTDYTFKHVKARVDTHWKKNDGTINVQPVNKPVTRSDSLKTLYNVGLGATVGKQASTVKSSVSVKSKVVHITKGAEIKKVKVINLKREESQLTRRSLTKLKQIRNQSNGSSSSSISSSGSLNEEVHGQEVK